MNPQSSSTLRASIQSIIFGFGRLALRCDFSKTKIQPLTHNCNIVSFGCISYTCPSEVLYQVAKVSAKFVRLFQLKILEPSGHFRPPPNTPSCQISHQPPPPIIMSVLKYAHCHHKVTAWLQNLSWNKPHEIADTLATRYTLRSGRYNWSATKKTNACSYVVGVVFSLIKSHLRANRPNPILLDWWKPPA